MALEEIPEWYDSVSVAARVTKDIVMILSCHDSVAIGVICRVSKAKEPTRFGEYGTSSEHEHEQEQE